MRHQTVISILLASSLFLASAASYAQNGPGGGGDRGNMDRGQQMDRDRGFDRDRNFDRDRMGDRDRAGMQERDRMRDRIHDPAAMRDGDIYGNELMSEQERKQYRQQLGAAVSEQARQQFQHQHEKRMQQRAL